MRCIRPAVIVSRGTTNISIGETRRSRGVFGKGLCFENSKTGAWKGTILDRLDFILGQKSTVSECDIDVV